MIERGLHCGSSQGGVRGRARDRTQTPLTASLSRCPSACASSATSHARSQRLTHASAGQGNSGTEHSGQRRLWPPAADLARGKDGQVKERRLSTRSHSQHTCASLLSVLLLDDPSIRHGQLQPLDLGFRQRLEQAAECMDSAILSIHSMSAASVSAAALSAPAHSRRCISLRKGWATHGKAMRHWWVWHARACIAHHLCAPRCFCMQIAEPPQQKCDLS